MSETEPHESPDPHPEEPQPGADPAPGEAAAGEDHALIDGEAPDEGDLSPEEMPIDDGRPIVALGSWSFFIKRLVIFGMLMAGYGGEFFFDGFIRYPEKQRIAAQLDTEGKPHDKAPSNMDIRLNQAIGVIVPPLGLILLVLTIYDIRGACQLEDDVLRVPGRPPIPLSAITNLDKTKWDRKGIAYVEYSLSPPDGPAKTSRVKLDDFAYEQGPIDRIVERIEAYIDRTAAAE